MATTSSILDVPSLVSQLMSIERKPIDKLNAKVTDIQARISSFGTLSGMVSTLQTSLSSLKTALQGYGATPSDANLFSATASTSAAAGSYTINISKLAQAQNLVAAGQISQTVSIPSVASTVTFTIGGNPMDVTIAAGASLQNIRDTINGANLGVTASIINDGSGTPYRLVLTANKTGLANGVSSITVQPGGRLWLDGAHLHNACGLEWKGIFIQEKNGVRGRVTALKDPVMDNCPTEKPQRERRIPVKQ